MATTFDRRRFGSLHPLHAILLGFPFPLFLGALLSDLAYSSSYEIQWTNFASWLIAGALLFGAFLLLWALVDLLRARSGAKGRPMLYFILILVMWALGFIDALVHAMDAWAKMPAAVILSAIVTVLALAAAWIGYSSYRGGEVR